MTKFTLAKVVSFLGHHVHDLHAVSSVLEGVVSALPINAETRANINASIERVKDSADNISASLANMGIHTDPEPVDPNAIIAKLVADYMAAHPQVGAPAPQKAAEDRTADNNAENQPRGTTGQQQVPQEGEGATAGSAGAKAKTAAASAVGGDTSANVKAK